MDPITILAVTSGALNLVEKLLPLIADLKKSGDITPAQQAELLAKFESLKAKADGQFSDPAWQVQK